MNSENLVTMANQIGSFYETMPDRAKAMSDIAEHIKKFWEPRMRREIIEYALRDGGDLKEIVRTAVLRLEGSQTPAKSP